MPNELSKATFISILFASFYLGFIGSDITIPSAVTFGIFLGHFILYAKRCW